MSEYERCGAVYSGPTYPAEHGVVCVMQKGHDVGHHGTERHMGRSTMRPDKPLCWYSREQKEARAKGKP